MTLTQKQKKIVLGALALLVIFFGWLTFTGLQAKHHLNDAQAALSELQMSDVLDHPQDVYATIVAATGDVEQANQILHSPAWTVVTHIPVIGRSVKASQVTAANVHQLMKATLLGTEGLKTFKHNPKKIIDPALINIATATISALNTPAHETVDALSSTDLRLVPGSVAEPIRKLQQDLKQALPFLEQGQSLVSIAPILLGVDKPRTWLLVMGNGAEARSIGGLPGGWGLLNVGQGKIDLVHQESNDNISSISLANWRSLVTQDAVTLYDDDLSRFTDMNLSPDFPTNGKLMEALYRQYSGKRTDGVLFTDEHTLAGLMQLTGPIAFRGKTFTSENVSGYIGKGVYADYADPKEKDRAVLGLTQKVFKTITSASPDLLVVAKTFLDLIAQGRLHVWSSNPIEQKKFESSPAGGSMISPESPKHAVVMANGAGNKIDAYIHSSVKYVQGKCQPNFPYRTSTMAVSMRNTAPTSGLPDYVNARLDLGPNIEGAGSTNMLTFIHVPLGATLLSATYVGKPANMVASGMENGRTVWRFDNVIAPQSRRTLLLKFIESAVSDDRPELLPQPMANDMDVQVELGASCG